MQKVERKENILDRKKTHKKERHSIVNVAVYPEIVKVWLPIENQKAKYCHSLKKLVHKVKESGLHPENRIYLKKVLKKKNDSGKCDFEKGNSVIIWIFN